MCHCAKENVINLAWTADKTDICYMLLADWSESEIQGSNIGKTKCDSSVISRYDMLPDTPDAHMAGTKYVRSVNLTRH